MIRYSPPLAFLRGFDEDLVRRFSPGFCSLLQRSGYIFLMKCFARRSPTNAEVLLALALVASKGLYTY